MVDARPYLPGVSGSGGGGLTLGPPTNTFTAASRTAAETARDAYATANATWLASYDDEATYTIVLAWPATPTNTIYQSRRGAAWADVTGLVRGPRGIGGIDGDDGSQARFTVYGYINLATAPTTAPASTTFVQSTDTLTLPTGYAPAPSTPATTEQVYRIEAEVNPAVDADTVTLVWPVPVELPAYLVVAEAEAAAARAAASAAAAAADAALVDSYDGPAAILDAVAFESNNLDVTVPSWRDYDFLLFIARDSDATTQFDRPASLVPTVTLDSVGESRVAINNNDELRVESTAGSDVLQVNITGWSGHPTTGDVLTVLGIRSGVEAGGGGGGVGPPGPAGPAGMDGTDGMDGAAGAAGADGAQGPTGPAGAAGADGTDGTDGADGAGAAPAQDEGTVVVATPTAYNFVGDGVVVSNVGGVATVTIVGGGAIAMSHTLYAGFSADTAVNAAEVLTGASSDTDSVTLPTATGSQYLWVWRSDTDGGDPTEIHIAGGGNQRNIFGVAAALTVDSIDGQLIVTITTQNAGLLSGESLRVV